jgi:hypothetical protein
MIRGSLQKWSIASYYHIIIDCIDKRADRSKELEFQLRKMLELNKQSQTTEEKSKSNIGNVIRRRKGEPDKFIPQKANNR